MEPFHGVVMLKDWINDPRTGRSVKAVAGRIGIQQDEELVGFRTRGTESNWSAVIDGPAQTWVVLGCQIRAVVKMPLPEDVQDLDSDTLVVP